MSVLIDTSTRPSRIGVPSVPWWAVPRTRLDDRLDAAVTGPLTMISAPTGSGKTMGVASWVRNLHPSVGVIWVKLGKDLTADGLLDQISAELAQPGRAVLVCDDFPAEPSEPLIQDIAVLLSQTDRQLSIILICAATPIVRFHYLPAGPTMINFDDLVMDASEVRFVLDQHRVKTSEATIRAVLEHSAGWAAGVSLAASALAQLSRSNPWAIDSAPTLDHRRGDDHEYNGIYVVPLTSRETEVLKLLAQLCSNEEIAADLVLSLNTVKTHMRSLFQKLSVSRRADAVRRGRALGLC